MNLRFRLRTLLLAVTCLASVLGWRSYNVQRIAAARAAIDRLAEAAIQVDDTTRTDYLGLTFSQLPYPKFVLLWQDAQPGVLCAEIASSGVLNSVEDVNAADSVLGRNDLAALALLPHLSVLDIGLNEICDDDLKRFGGCRQLKEIRIAGASVTDAGIAHLSNLSSLRTLQLRETGIRGDGWNRLRFIGALEVLDVSFTPFAEPGFAAVSKSSIKKLVLAGVPVDRTAARAIGQMPQLEELYLGDTGTTDAEIVELLGLRRLRILNLNGAAISDTGVEKLAALPALESLIVLSTKLRGECFRGAWQRSGLKKLDVHRCAITSAGWECIARLPELDYLDARGSTFDDHAALRLAGAARLKWLLIHNSSVTDAGLARLHHRGLVSIDVRNTKVTPEFARKAIAEHGQPIAIDFEAPAGVLECFPLDVLPLAPALRNQTFSDPP